MGVASNLSTPPSESYQEIGEQISLGVLHRTLLIHNQQQLMVRQPSEHAHAVKNLAAKNKELLAQIDNKNMVLRNRQLLLDNFSLDQDKLAAWLRDMEREKQLLNLKYIAVKRLPSILKKIQQLLDKLPKGEKLYKQLVLVQCNLKSNFNSSVMSSTRSEVYCLQERLSSLKAGLLTWMDHLQRIEELSANCENLSKHIDDQLATYDAHIESLLPVLSDHVLADVQICQENIHHINQMTASLKQLEGLQEELSEALAPSDVKQLNQKMWILWQKHSDLKHKLSIRLQILKVKTERVELFNIQHSQFSEWLKKTEQKLRKNDDNIVDLLTRYENIYKDEIDLKDLLASRQSKLSELLESQLKLETKLSELKLWMSDFEKKVQCPWKFTAVNPEEKKKLDDMLVDMERKIKQNSERVSLVLNQGEMLLSDNDSPGKMSPDIYKIQKDLIHIECRWKNLCSNINQRKEENHSTWIQLQNYDAQFKHLKSRLDQKVAATAYNIQTIKLNDCQSTQKQLDEIMQELKESLTSLDEFNSFYCTLAKEGKLDDEGELKKMHLMINEQWDKLSNETLSKIEAVNEKQNTLKSIEGSQNREMTWLRQIDAQLTELQYSRSMDDESKEKKLMEIQNNFETRTSKIESIKNITNDISDQWNQEDSKSIYEDVQALVSLHSDVEARLKKLLDDLCIDDLKHQSDQNIQVDTLKLEQDRSVQADTLSLPYLDSGVYISSITSPAPETPDDLPELESDDPNDDPLPDLTNKTQSQIREDLDQNLENCNEHINSLDESMEITDDIEFLNSQLKTCKSVFALCQQCSSSLNTDHGLQGIDIKDEQIQDLGERIKFLQQKLTEKNQTRRRNWRQL